MEEISRARKPRPSHEAEVDKILFKCADYKQGLPLQYAKLKEVRMKMDLGRRTIPVYKKLEGVGGEFRVEEEDIIIRQDEIEQRIRYMEGYIHTVEGLIDYAFKGDEDKKRFVDEYWLQSIPRDIRTRRREVLAAMPFLTHDSFYTWRGKIYARLAEVVGIEVGK